jgi:hemerythrin-like domain-containing protein
MAKKKKAVKKRAAARTSGRKPAPARKTAPQSRTARRKTAARAAASRSTAKRSAKKKRASGAKKGKTSPRLASAASTVRGVMAGAVQRVAGSLPWSGDENDPIALLESDHRRFEDLMKQGEETTGRAVKGRTALLGTLTAALDLHELIEEKVLYPALEPHAEARDIVLEGFQEHHVADLLVKELHDLAKDDEQWGAKFKVLKESLEHHIEEEEGTMFPAARKVLSGEELQELGARMRKLRAQNRKRPAARR